MIIDEGVFEVANEAEGWNEQVMVFCDDPQAAARALLRASPRLQRVLWDGREVDEEEWDASWQALEAHSAAGTLADADDPIDAEQMCEYVSEPDVHDDGASIYMDTNSELTRAAAETFFAIISEELLAEGIESARLAEHDV
jgi:hypothetical protein